MRIENQHIFYRTRFRVIPYTTRDVSAPWILQTLYNWILDKEEMRGNNLTPLGNTLEDSCINIKEHSDEINNSYYYSQLLAKGMRYPKEYRGGVEKKRRTCLCSRAIIGAGSELAPEIWAMDYDEPDSRLNNRRWHTSVGYVVDYSDNSCIVNVRIINYMRPGFIGNTPEQPLTNVPRFVKELIRPRYGESPFQVCVGDTVMSPQATQITIDNINDMFISDLLAPDRKAPMVLISSNRDGEFLIDPTDIADKLIGAANVFSIDASDRSVTSAYGQRFGTEGDLKDYSVKVNQLRVYQPEINQKWTGDSRRHRYFGFNEIQNNNDFSEMIARSIMRNWSRDQSGVTDVSDVEVREARLKNKKLRQRLDELVKKNQNRNTEEVSEELTHEERITKLEEEVNTWQALAIQYADAANDEVDLQAETYENILKDISEELEEYRVKNELLDNDLTNEKQKVKRLEHENREAYQEKEKAQATLESERIATEALRSIDSIPNNARELLELFSRIEPTKIVVLPNAFDSAANYKGKTTLDEMLEMLKSVSSILWSVRFEGYESVDIAKEYMARTNFGLAMSESKLTNRDADLMRMRTFNYRGKPTDFSAHIKGRAKHQKDALRLHFAFDVERKLVVIGHFGHHLKTAGTQKLH